MNKIKSKLIVLPHSSLRQRSKKVSIIDAPVTELVDAMQKATLDWEDSRKHGVGVALAAVQINNLSRVVIIRNNFEDKTDRTFKVFINPEIVKYEGEIVEDYEGCLSIKDVYGKVPRHSKIRVSALDTEGKKIRLKAEGFLARVFQHEIDHTHGTLFIDHIKDDRSAFFTLTEEGKLEELDYDQKIAGNSILWE